MRQQVVGGLARRLFGSFARGTADADSDIDVLVVRPERVNAATEDAWLDQLARLHDKIRSWTETPRNWWTWHRSPSHGWPAKASAGRLVAGG